VPKKLNKVSIVSQNKACDGDKVILREPVVNVDPTKVVKEDTNTVTTAKQSSARTILNSEGSSWGMPRLSDNIIIQNQSSVDMKQLSCSNVSPINVLKSALKNTTARFNE